MSANYQGQTGPKSPAGKNKVRFNALKHGLYAKSKILPTENPKEYQRLLRAVFEDINPQGMIEERIYFKNSLTLAMLGRLKLVRVQNKLRLFNQWNSIFNNSV